MVFRGPSQGCLTCRRRKVKCDERRPTCQRCATKNIPCELYGKKPRRTMFKDQTNIVKARLQNQANRTQRLIARTAYQCMPGSLSSLVPSDEQSAVGFFLRDIASAGRTMNSDRGLFECIIPCLTGTADTYILRSAIATLAVGLIDIRRRTESDLYRSRLCRTVENLRKALTDPVQSRTTEVLMAMLLLQLNEDIHAALHRREAKTIHQNGALALVRHRGVEKFRTEIDQSLLLYVRYLHIATAIQKRKPVSIDLSTWCSGYDTSQNPSSDLDKIGVHVANLQYSYTKIFRKTKYVPGDFKILFNRALMIDHLLETWPTHVPSYWKPVTLRSVDAHNPPIVLYQEICEVYPSAQIAFTWNTFRLYRIMVLKIMIEYNDMGMATTAATANKKDSREYLCEALQDAVDAICFSVPFYLGNRMIMDTGKRNTHIEFPGYRLLNTQSMPEGLKSNISSLKDDHKRHMIAQGTWLIMRVLHDLFSLLMAASNERIRNILRPGQLEWIKNQLDRTTQLMGIERMVREDELKSGSA